MSGFRLAAPWWLLLLLVFPYLARRKRRLGLRPGAIRRPALSSEAMAGSGGLRLALRGLPDLLRRLATILVIVAAARPQAGNSREVVRGEGVDIVVALDISGSMASLDFQPDNRLEASKNVIRAFVEERTYDRIGLVVFANEAFKQSPITIDHAILGRQLDQIELAQDLGIDDGTAIGLGLASAADLLRESDFESRMIILLTDGANNAGEIDPKTAAEAAAALGIRVYTIGAGKTGEVPIPVPGIFGDRLVYQESDLDEETLREVASITGGQYFRATDSQGLAAIYREISAMEPSEVEIQTFVRWRELAGWLLAPALMLLLLALALRAGPLKVLP
jgi:Ca-activated chloride channel family protein